MNKYSLENQLQKVEEVKSHSRLRKRLTVLIDDLPYSVGPNYPLFTFRLAIAGLLLFLLTGLGTGVVLGAKGSNQGSLLFPLKKVIVQTQIHFAASEHEKETLRAQIQVSTVPTVTPVPPTPTKYKENENTNKNKDVQGTSTEQQDQKEVHIKIHTEIDDNNNFHFAISPTPRTNRSSEKTED